MSVSRKERYHCLSLDALDFEGVECAGRNTPESILVGNTAKESISNALDELSEVQRRRLPMLADGMSVRETARAEGVKHAPVLRSIERARKIFKEYF